MAISGHASLPFPSLPFPSLPFPSLALRGLSGEAIEMDIK